MFFMQTFDVIDCIAQGRQETDCGRFVEYAYELFDLLATDVVSLGHVVGELAAIDFFKPMLLHPYIECPFPVQHTAIDVGQD